MSAPFIMNGSPLDKEENKENKYFALIHVCHWKALQRPLFLSSETTSNNCLSPVSQTLFNIVNSALILSTLVFLLFFLPPYF